MKDFIFINLLFYFNAHDLKFQKYNQGLSKKKSVSSVLLNKENLASHLLEVSPRMLPPGN